MTVTIRKGSDPFKKFWWVILLAFGAIGGWVCLPLMDSSASSAPAFSGAGLRTPEQSLDSTVNPNGAPGSAVDLSMEGANRKQRRDDQDVASALYQAPPASPEASAAGSPILPGKGSASYADALKAVSRKKADVAGWGGDKPQKGFNPPKVKTGGLSGLGSGGGGSGANVSAGTSPFGTAVAKTGLTATHGLGEGSADAKSGAPVMSSLRAAQAQGAAALAQKGADASRSVAGRIFDGGSAGTPITADQGQSQEGAYASMDAAAPMSLKPNDTSIDVNQQSPVPAYQAPMDTSQQMKERLVLMLAGVLAGGLIGGVAGQMVMMGTMMASATMGYSQNSGSNVTAQTQGVH